MDCCGLHSILLTQTYQHLRNNPKILIDELIQLGIPQEDQLKLAQKILEITKITTNTKTIKSLLRSIMRTHHNKITKDGRGSSIVLEITRKCNKQCLHCYLKSAKHQQSMSDKVLHTIVQYARNNYKHIFLTGGEPTMDSRVFTLAENNPGIIFYIFTNGSNLTYEYTKQLSMYGNLIPLLGIDGASQSTHDRLRGRGSYQEVMQAIIHLTKHNVAWGFITLVTEQNAQEVLSPDFIADKVQKGACMMRYLEYLPVGSHPLRKHILSGKTYYLLEKRKKEIISSGSIYMQDIVQFKCRGLLYFDVDGYIKNCFSFHLAKYNVTDGDIDSLVKKTRTDWTSYKWNGECPLYSDPIGLKKHLENRGWKHGYPDDEPYLNDPNIARTLMDQYRIFLKLEEQNKL